MKLKPRLNEGLYTTLTLLKQDLHLATTGSVDNLCLNPN